MFTQRINNTLILHTIAVFLLGVLLLPFPATANTYRGAVSPKPQAEAAPAPEAAAPAVPSTKTTTATPAPSTPKKTTTTQSTPKKSAATKKAATTKKTNPQKKQTKAVQKKDTKKASSKAAATQATTKKQQSASSKKATPKKAASAAKAKASKTSSTDLHLNVKAALLVNMTTGKVYFEQNPDKPIAPASITKVLTLYLLRESLAQGKLSWKTAIPISSQALATGGSSMHLNKGEKVPLPELVKGISVVSANNACVAVAEYLGKGDPKHFVRQMNAKAKQIGMTKSQFKNPNGLPAPGQLSTARDLAKLSMSYIRAFPESLSFHSMTTHSYNGVTHRNANSLLRVYPGVDGLKTGFVCSSGYNITATAKRGNTRLVAVVLGAQNAMIRQIETARLLDYGFKRAAMESGGKGSAPKNSSKKTKKQS